MITLGLDLFCDLGYVTIFSVTLNNQKTSFENPKIMVQFCLKSFY